MEPISPCICRNPSRSAVRSVRHVSIARSEYLLRPPRDHRLPKKQIPLCCPCGEPSLYRRGLARVFKTEFILDYLSQPALRTRIRRGLLKGEQLHALARCVYYGRLGRLDQRDFERQTGAASCLLLILAAIIYWQIREIDRVLSEAGSDADDLNFELLSHISPIGWDNVLLYGEYQLNRSLVRSERLSV